VVNAPGGEAAAEEEPPATKRAPRPRHPRRRKEETIATPVTDANTATGESVAEAPVAIEPTIEPTTKPEVATAAERTNDAKPSDEATPEQPSRKGWWNRLLS
jgi:hypothetical protein